MTFKVHRPPYRPRWHECPNCQRYALYITVLGNRGVCIGCDGLLFAGNQCTNIVPLVCADDWLHGLDPVMGGMC